MKARTIDIYDCDTYYYTSVTVFFETMEEYYHKINQIMARYPDDWYYED